MSVDGIGGGTDPIADKLMGVGGGGDTASPGAGLTSAYGALPTLSASTAQTMASLAKSGAGAASGGTGSGGTSGAEGLEQGGGGGGGGGDAQKAATNAAKAAIGMEQAMSSAFKNETDIQSAKEDKASNVIEQ